MYFIKRERNLSLFTNCIFIRALHGDARSLSLNYCMANAQEFVGTGLHGMVLKIAIRVYEIIRKLF